jgi:dihydrofolate reductase
MAKSVLYMSMSLDGFITGPDDGPGNGLGTGGNRLHEWLGEPVSELPRFDPPGLSGQVFAELMATGAVVVGRKTFDYAGHWDGDHHGVPIFVPTRGTPPAPQSGWVPLRARRRDSDARGQGGRRRRERDGPRRFPCAVVAA